MEPSVFEKLFSEYMETADYIDRRAPSGTRVGLMIDSAAGGAFVIGSWSEPERGYTVISPNWASPEGGNKVLRRLRGYCRELYTLTFDDPQAFIDQVRSAKMHRATSANGDASAVERLVYTPFIQWGMERPERNPARIIIWNTCMWEVEIRAYGSLSFSAEPGPRQRTVWCDRYYHFPQSLTTLALEADSDHLTFVDDLRKHIEAHPLLATLDRTALRADEPSMPVVWSLTTAARYIAERTGVSRAQALAHLFTAAAADLVNSSAK